MIRRFLFMFAIVIFTSGCLNEHSRPSSLPTIIELTPTSIPTQIQPTLIPTETGENYSLPRSRMVDNQIAARGIDDQAILEAMLKVPRHEFVPEDMRHLAYNDHPLPIGYGQTISQPFIVALMTQTIDPKPGQRVLEIGTGSGYQAAILAEMGADVYTVEIIPELAQQAAQRFNDLGYTNITTLTADGYFGWQEHAPFDAIMVTAAPDHLPQPLANQLIDGGRLVIPIGPIGFLQSLWLFEKTDGELEATNLGGVSFVPLTGER